MPNRYLVFLSGGFDSTAALLKILEDDPSADVDIVHLVIKNAEARWPAEQKAYHNIRAWLSSRYLYFNYEQFIVEFGESKPYPYDTFVVAMYASQLIRRKPRYDFVVTGVVGTDDQTWHGQYRTNIRTSCYFHTVLTHAEQEPVPWKYPVIGMTKKQCIQFLIDKEFPLSACFTCRRPVDVYKACGECASCVEYQTVLAELGMV